MRSIRFFLVTVGTLAALGGPVLDVIAADTSAVKMSYSANENYLRRFRKEREALAQSSDPASAEKLAALDKKIKNLEAENARLATVLQKNGGAPPARPAEPAASAPAPAPISAPAPVQVSAPAVQPAPAAAPVKASLPVKREPIPIAPGQPSGPAVSEWEKMSRDQKEKYVQTLVNDLKKQGMAIERHPLFYAALMDYVFVSDASMAAKSLKEAIVLTIQKNETSWRALRQS